MPNYSILIPQAVRKRFTFATAGRIMCAIKCRQRQCWSLTNFRSASFFLLPMINHRICGIYDRWSWWWWRCVCLCGEYLVYVRSMLMYVNLSIILSVGFKSSTNSFGCVLVSNRNVRNSQSHMPNRTAKNECSQLFVDSMNKKMGNIGGALLSLLILSCLIVEYLCCVHIAHCTSASD